MLFTIQAYLEDFLTKRGLSDSDGYALRLANLYFYQRPNMDTHQFLRKVRRINTVLFVNNGIRDRSAFEEPLVRRLDRHFKKKLKPHNSSKIFISYRRQDSADVCGRIYDSLAQHFGDEAVFKDVDDIPFGDDFARHIETVLAECAVELVVIGPGWLDATDDKGQRRLDDPEDFVRMEVERGLSRDILVIPLLVSGASMPNADQLPPSLTELARLNGIPIRPDPDFHKDMGRLIGQLEEYVLSQPAGPDTLADAQQRLEERPPLQARLEHVALKAAKIFSYWRLGKDLSTGLDDQQLLSDWLIDGGVDDMLRDYGVLCTTIDILNAEGLKVEHIPKSEFDALIHAYDNPPRL
jgi:hypothetical protein